MGEQEDGELTGLEIKKGKPERRRLLRVVIQLRERVQRSWQVAYAMCAQALVYSCVDAFCISRSSEAT